MAQTTIKTGQPLLAVDNLEVSFHTKAGPQRAIRGISYAIHKQETLGVVGESGCGKTVTSLAILRLLGTNGEITNGKICFDGTDLLTLPGSKMRRVRGGKIAMIFQEPMTAFNPVLTVGKQIIEQMSVHHEGHSIEELKDKAITLLKKVEIPSPEKRFNQYPHELSGGMRQRAMIAMALSCHPSLLIADEPTTALDVTIQAQILDLLLELQEELGMAIQFITHDMGVISEVSDRIMVMYAGIIAEMGDAQAIMHAPRHPYTVGLLASIPKMEATERHLKTIEGSVPSLSALPKGCPFQNRCPRVLERCRMEEVKLERIGEDHSIACFNPHVA